MDRALLEAALIGYRKQVSDMSAKITEIEQQLRGKSPKGRLLGKRAPLKVVADKPKRKMSVAARKRIAAAQHKRWKAYHAAQAKTA